MLVSVGVHGLVILLFLFLMAWREPNPPYPEYGIEINFGTDDAGSGPVQPEIPVSEETETESESDSEQSEETTEEVTEEVLEEEVIQPEEQVSEEVSEDPDIVSEEIDAESLEEASPPEEVVETPVDEKPTPVEETPETEKSEGAKGESKEEASGEEANQGDKTDETGDQGDPEGQIDARALYGKVGGGDGVSISMTGWTPDFAPKPNDTSDESGKIVFEIKIDDQGEIISVRTVETSVSPAVEKIYREEVEKLTFSPSSTNTIPAPVSTGKITFLIKSK